MNLSFYERHSYKDPAFQIIFHLDTLLAEDKNFVMHWHENLEILYFIDGKAQITCDMNVIEAEAYDIVCINSNKLHSIMSLSDCCKYYCLIIDKNLCESFDSSVKNVIIKSIIRDSSATLLFDKIVKEMFEKKVYHKSIVKANSIELFLYLCRYFSVDENILLDTISNTKLTMVKSSIEYIKNNFKDNITIDDICKNIGFSKYYFCRVFKEVTNKTVVDYINFLRCDNARKLLATGNYNATESAELCGFKNLSYFSKIYKKYIGRLPSIEYRNKS